MNRTHFDLPVDTTPVIGRSDASAIAGLSMRQAADALGMSLTGYQHYEDRFKKAFLPVELMRTWRAPSGMTL